MARLPWHREAHPRQPLCLYFSKEPARLEKEIQYAYMHPVGPGRLPPQSGPPVAKKGETALLVSHGAYVDGGPVSANAFAFLAARGVPSTVLIIGTNHRGIGEDVALSARPWATPLGLLLPNQQLLARLVAAGLQVDERGHEPEHSIENQLPFLQHLRRDIKMVALGISHLASLQDAEALAQTLATAVRADGDVLLLATTDYTHSGGPYPEQPPADMPLIDYVRSRDREVVDSIRSGVPTKLVQAAMENGLHRCMCGFWPALVLMRAAQLLDFSEVALHRYAVSTEIAPNDGATGFAAFSFSKPSS
eukprot:TRINITY_DN22339_c0_g1_i2.p1 TRINITY_DN22339_c0_g1~~TRINITY_DN22339_c0_g1_i2.p1  ORF type:complete len:306 (-),score=56.02 TRINITY_DN22339_c0_g1_i2:250-1167(-)